MRSVLLSVLVGAFVGVAASIASCGAAFADGAQGQNAPPETKAYVRKVMGNDAGQDTPSNQINAQQAMALLGLSPAAKPNTTPTIPAPASKPAAATGEQKGNNAISDPNQILQIIGYSPKPSAATGQQKSTKPAADIPKVPGYTLTPVDYNPFAWYRQPVSSGVQKIAAWFLLAVSVLMLFMMTRMRWFNQRYVGWNRLFVALSGLWLSAMGGVLILIGGVPIEEWAGIVYVPVIGFWVFYKLTAWVIGGFAK